MNPLIRDARRRWMFLGGVVLLLLAAVAFVPLKWVRVKMLPFDNKSEFQVIIDMPDGTPLEQTTRVAQALGQYLGQQPEVINYQIYAGTSGPYNFNGLVRHYFLRNQPNQADIQVNLLSRHDRKAQSHEIARRLRPELDKIAAPFGARIKVAEVPPGPPVLQTLVAEVYGPDYKGQTELAAKIKKVFQQTPGVVDVDWYVEDPQTKYDMKVDLDKAALHGISAAEVTRTVQVGLERSQRGPAARSPFARRCPDRSAPVAPRSLRNRGPRQPEAADSLRWADRSARSHESSTDDNRYQRLPQESAARGLCDGRCSRRRRKPCVRHHEDERCDRQNQIARWLWRKAIQGHDHARAH